MPEALPSVRSGVARSEGTSQSGCPVRFTHSVAAGADRAASVLASVVAYVDLPECVAALLRQHLNGRTHGYVFETRNGKPKSDHNIADRHLIPLLEEAGNNSPARAAVPCFPPLQDYGLAGGCRARQGWSAGTPHQLLDWAQGPVYQWELRLLLQGVRGVAEELAEKAGTGFEVPIKLGLVGPKRPMLDPNPAEVQRVASSVEEAA